MIQNSVESAVVQSLKESYDLHESLGEDGQAMLEQNRFGDQAMVADVGAERVMIETLSRHGVSGPVHSEEHGVTSIEGSNDHLIVMDGLDGSSVYKKARGKELYGTMLTVFENDNPVYDEYVTAGIALHSLHQIIIASKGKGIRVFDARTDEEMSFSPSVQSLTDGRIFVDDGLPDETAVLYPYFKTNFDTFGEPLRAAGLNPEHTGSSAAYYALLALGKASLVGEATRKGNLEHATAHALVIESGGTMIDAVTREPLGDKKFLSYGQADHIPTLASSSPEIEAEALAILDARS